MQSAPLAFLYPVSLDRDATSDPESQSQVFWIRSACRQCRGKKKTEKQQPRDYHHLSPLIPISSMSHYFQEPLDSLNYPVIRFSTQSQQQHTYSVPVFFPLTFCSISFIISFLFKGWRSGLPVTSRLRQRSSHGCCRLDQDQMSGRTAHFWRVAGLIRVSI